MEDHEEQYLALSLTDIANAVETTLFDLDNVGNPETSNDIFMRNAFYHEFAVLSPVQRDHFITANDFYIAGFRCSQVMDQIAVHHDTYTYNLIEGTVHPPVEIYNQVVRVVLGINPVASSELECKLIEGFENVLSRISDRAFSEATIDICAFLSGYTVVWSLYNSITD